MKFSSYSFRAILLAALAFPFALNASPSPHSAESLLQTQGSVRVRSVGPHVAAGTYQIQVSTKLGRPDARLPDGSWLYYNRRVESTDAEGILVIRFTQGRVSDLLLASPMMISVLRAGPAGHPVVAQSR